MTLKPSQVQNRIAELPEVKQKKPNLYDVVNISLSSAQNDALVALQGDFLYVLDVPASSDATVKFNEASDDAVDLKKGRRFQVPFRRFYLTSSAMAGQTLKLLIGKDLSFDFAELGEINIDSIAQPIKAQAANTWDVAGSPVAVDSTAGGTLIKAANAARQSITIINEGANPLRVGKTGVTFAGGAGAAGGVLIPAGGSFTFNHTGALYGITGAALATSVSFDEEYNV